MPDRRQTLAGLACAALAGAAAPAPAPRAAARYRWRNVTVGGGGFIPAILFSPVERGLAYARSDMGGIYLWDEPQRTWTPLQDDFAQPGAFGVESLAPDPRDADVVYAAVGMYGSDPAMVLRSANRGRTWVRNPVPFRMGGNEAGRGLGERLAVDPLDTRVLYFGSRHDGLQRSLDAGATWATVEGFPTHGLGRPRPGGPAHAGIAFVIIDPAGGAGRSRVLYAGVADPGEHHLYRSRDAGETWAPVAGQPRPGLLPAKAGLDGAGRLYVSYGDGIGPTGVTDGALWRLDLATGAWSDITPDRGPARPTGGYMGLSLSASRPGVLVAASMNRWKPGDDIWRSTDGGDTWMGLRGHSTRNVSASPFLKWGKAEADFGWWIAGLAIDPFDAERVVYTTGATVYETRKVSDVERGGPVRWTPWVTGIEQTAVLTLTSPPKGPPLLSGFGDISGFAHEDLGRSPASLFADPVFSNTNTIDYAGQAPNIVVRGGTPYEGGPTLAWSDDHGRSWKPLVAPPSDARRDAAIIVSADGAAFMVMTPTPVLSVDRGRTWRPTRGLPVGARPIADRVDGRRFFALDFETSTIWLSTDGGANFVRAGGAGLPGGLAGDRPTWREDAWPLKAQPGSAGALWLVARSGLFRSLDGGKTFAPVRSEVEVELLDFGKSAPGAAEPALFAVGRRGDLRAIWRSDDSGRSWIRVNDALHEYGRRFRCIAGDPRVFGRVYVGTDGRGIVFGEPAG